MGFLGVDATSVQPYCSLQQFSTSTRQPEVSSIMVPRRTFAGTLLAIAVAATSSSLSTRAAKPIELPLTWSETFGEYLVNISIGTPPQVRIQVFNSVYAPLTLPKRLALVYDSGSSDIWVSGRDTALCGTGACEIFGAFRPENSSTVNRTSLRLIEEYGSGGLVRGVFLQDTLEIAGVKIPNFAFGYATTVPADNVSELTHPHSSIVLTQRHSPRS